MKKIVSLFMSVVIALGIVMCPAANIFAIDAAAAHYVALQTPQDVYNIRNALDGNYVLACDIDLSEYNWEPIGTAEEPFTGSIDGNGYVLKNLTIRAHKDAKKGDEITNQAFIGVASGANIKNLGIVDASISYYLDGVYTSDAPFCNVSGFVGEGKNSTVIEKCRFTGKITGKSTLNSFIRASAFGCHVGSTIKDCYSNADISGSADYCNTMVAGIAAWNDSTVIERCYAAGSLKGVNTNAPCYVGGIAASGGGTIKKSFNLLDKMTYEGKIQSNGTSLVDTICAFATLSNNGVIENICNTVPNKSGVKFSKAILTSYGVYEYIGWDYSTVWEKVDGFPTHKVEHTYETSDFVKNGFQVFTDKLNLSINVDEKITLGVDIYTNGIRVNNLSGVSFYVEDPSILEVVSVITKDNTRYVKLKGIKIGNTSVVFSDSGTGYVTKIPVTVYDNGLMYYTLDSVPEKEIEKGRITNVYNSNGIYIDSFDYEIKNNGDAIVKFDVYNENYSYGVVEVLNEDDSLHNAVVIGKHTNNADSIKASVWDNSVFLIRDIRDGEMLSYRGEIHTKRTPVSVEVPKGGYIKITTDAKQSAIVALINSFDILTSYYSIVKGLFGFKYDSEKAVGILTKKLLDEEIFKYVMDNQDEVCETVCKNIGKNLFLSEESVGNFLDTLIKNIVQMDFDELFNDVLSDLGWSAGESIFEALTGFIGATLKGMFIIGDMCNLATQCNNFSNAMGTKCIGIENQGGGIRAVSQVKVESENDFADDVSLSAFTVEPDKNVLNSIKNSSPDLYQKICKNKTITYNISMLKNGEEKQPDSKVKVYIPIPEEMKELSRFGAVTVYRQEDDGSMTAMDATVENGQLVFETEHFSLYTIVAEDNSEDNYVTDVLDYSYTVSDVGDAVITAYTGADEKIAVPTRIDGYVVSGIGANCFADKTNLKSIKISDSVRFVGNNAFNGCASLTSVDFADRIEELSADAFENCSELDTFSVDNDNESYSAVDGVLFSKDLKELVKYPSGKDDATYTVPETVTKIRDRAFSTYSKLSEITISTSVTQLGTDVFASNEGCKIYCYEDTAAHNYAKNNSMNYELFDYTPIGKTSFDFSNNIVFTEQECSTGVSDFMLGCKTNGIEFVGLPSYKNNGELFGTGSTIFVYKSGAMQNPLNLVVRGDVNGDSVCDVIDCAKVENMVSKNGNLSGMNFFAADSDSNDEINVLDYQAIVNRALE